MPLNIRIQWNAGAACVSECVLKTSLWHWFILSGFYASNRQSLVVLHLQAVCPKVKLSLTLRRGWIALEQRDHPNCQKYTPSLGSEWHPLKWLPTNSGRRSQNEFSHLRLAPRRPRNSESCFTNGRVTPRLSCFLPGPLQMFHVRALGMLLLCHAESPRKQWIGAHLGGLL